MQKSSKIYVSGHMGLLGSSIIKNLRDHGYTNLIFRTHSELDLTDQKQTFEFYLKERPEYVFLAAAKVGGIKANLEGLGEFLYKNTLIQLNTIEAARISEVKKLLFVASTCIYPQNVQNPINEKQLMTGSFEPTNEGYAVAKFSGVKMCEMYRKQYSVDFISAIPCNLYGLNDHYDLNHSHVLQSLIVKVHNAKLKGERVITLWGSGKPRREFMSSNDCADALVFLMNNYSENDPVNVGTGTDMSIVELAQTVSKSLEWDVDFQFDSSKPDGIYQKLSDTSKINKLGWYSKVSLEEGIKISYADYLNRISQ